MNLFSFEDKLLLARLQRKDKNAFIEFYGLYLDKIYRYIFFKVGVKEEAEDLTSAVFLKIWNCVQEGSISDYSTLKPFAYTIARNLVIDHYRKNSNKKMEPIERVGEDGNSKSMEFADESPSIEDKIDLSLDIEIVRNRMRDLKDEYREVLVLRYMDGMSTKEISQIINRPGGNTRVLLHRALKALKELVEKNQVK